MPAHLTSFLIMLPLLALVVWRRVRSSFGRQRIRRKRMLARIAILVVVGGVLSLGGLHNPALAEGLLGGVLIGAVLGLLALRLTRFESDPRQGDCYVPDPWIGAALAALLLGRLAWRLMVLWPSMQVAGAGTAANSAAVTGQHTGYASSPLTMLVIGLLVGYYIAYYSAVLIRHRRLRQAQSRRVAP